MICSNCLEAFKEKIKSDLLQANYKFKTKTLIVWNKSETQTFKSHVLMQLKGSLKKPKIWSELAWSFVQKNKISEQYKNYRFVPAPAKIHKNEDHAYQWCEAIVKILGCEVSHSLKRVTDSGEQKKKSLEERKESQMRSVEPNTEACNERKIIFFDDIVASGSTAEAAFKALGEPPFFEVWAVAHRPKLAR